LLQVKELRVHYGKAEALKGVSIQVSRGSIITLIGANGSGKTSMMRAISGLKRLSSGEVWFQGGRIDGMGPHKIVRLGIAHIPEGRRVILPLTVLENMEIGAYLRKDKKEIADSLEKIYGHFPVLKERRKQVAGSLSGGEQQMLATARALMTNPRLLLMDEPSLGLSPLLVEEVGKIINNIHKEGVGIILVEQNAHMALKLAQRAYVLEVGNVVLEGDAADLIHDEQVRRAYLGG
jgi:branched-chain amino acid transport system ATP-binding protein